MKTDKASFKTLKGGWSRCNQTHEKIKSIKTEEYASAYDKEQARKANVDTKRAQDKLIDLLVKERQDAYIRAQANKKFLDTVAQKIFNEIRPMIFGRRKTVFS